ncbi:MAG: saccharopine dehydrogenase [Pseudomonadota bacterium]
MSHIWLRAEQRQNEKRTGLTPDGAAELLAQGHSVTVEESPTRTFPIGDYAQAGCITAPAGSWVEAPSDAVILGLKELPDNESPLRHRHVMFGHAFKGQHAGRRLLERFRRGGGALYDLEHLVDERGHRVAAFGYWAGYVGAAVSLKAWAAQRRGEICPPVNTCKSKAALLTELRTELTGLGAARPSVIVIGALGRVGTGAVELCEAVEIAPTKWDMRETAPGGPFPEILDHSIFLNCILARPGIPAFVPREAMRAPRRLTVIGDIACDPDSDYNPIPIYDRATSWKTPVTRVYAHPPLDVMAIDNLPSLLPREASESFAAQLLPALTRLHERDEGIWARAKAIFQEHLKG